MGPIGHTLISGSVGGGVWVATGSTGAAALALGLGVLMDVDHLYDYYQRYAKGRCGKIYVLLHGWEYSLIGLGVYGALGFQHPVLMAVVLTHLAHLAADHWHNSLTPLGYSIVFRALKGFNRESISRDAGLAALHHDRAGPTNLDRRLALWCERKVQLFLMERTDRAPNNPAARHQPDE